MQDSRVGVVFLLNSLRVGGAEKHTLSLFNRLDARHFRSGLIYLKREEHLLPQVENIRREHVWCADFGHGWDTGGALRLAAWLKRFVPDVLVCVNSYPLFFGYVTRALARLRCRIVEVFHSTELPDSKAKRHQWFYRWFFNCSDHIIYVSENQRHYWEARGMRTDRGMCIHNGIDVEYFRDRFSVEEKTALRAQYGFTSKDFVVGLCAALRREKMHGDLLKALARLNARGIPMKALLIGDGPEREKIQEEIGALGLHKDVAITGFQSDVRLVVAACDCMTLTSHSVETFSLAALEAMSMGRPMVMSEVGGAAEQVVDGESGFLYQRGDIDGLVRALMDIASGERRLKMGLAARQRVLERFCIETMIDRYAEVLAETAGRFDVRRKPCE